MTEPLENLTDRPNRAPDDAPPADLLSHVLAQIGLTGDHVRSHRLQAMTSLDLTPDAGHVLVVAEGALQADGGGAPLDIDTGDLVLLPRGPGAMRLKARAVEVLVIVCRFSFDPHSLRGMVAALPPFIHIRRGEGTGWLEGIVPFLLVEAGDEQPGAALMISRIIDLLIIRTLRTWVHLGRSSGWLGGLSDPRIARVLKLIHEKPLGRWSLDAMAEAAGMSRSSFSERFTALVGCAPLRYQNEWRLNLAKEMLARREARVGEVGLRIGYESEAAFSRAYKALFGHSPREEAGIRVARRED